MVERDITSEQSDQRDKEHNFLGKKISGIFTIPAGIITTDIKVLARIAQEIPEIGVITTKSIGLKERLGNKEPIITQYAPGCFMNAVGLTNLGAEAFSQQLKKTQIPNNKFLLTSIFGGNIEEFVSVAKILAPYSDGLEINLSCPHSKEYGMALGQDPKLVQKIIYSIKKSVNIPVIPKLTPNVTNIVNIAEAAIRGGADALCLINTVGPGYYSVDGYPVLSNQTGGISGKGILPISLKSIKEITEKFQIPIIGCGGISSADDLRAYRSVGSSIFGVGSALAGLSTRDLKSYFHQLNEDYENGTNKATAFLKEVEMNFTQYQLVENRKLANDLSLLVFNKDINIKPGQFVFAWVPGIGEKPFSVLDNDPLTLIVQKRGCFTERLISLSRGKEVYFRGPYGNPVEIKREQKPILVAGGCGMAALYGIVKEFPQTEVFFGAKDQNHLFYIEKIKQYIKTINVATDDGSEGYKGSITELLAKKLSSLEKKEDFVFFNCGPEKMIEIATTTEKKYTSLNNIYNSQDYVVKCGIGLCGSCATENGSRLCVDGPFIANSANCID